MNTLNDVCDAHLIRSYVDGDNAAFDELIDRHKDRVYNYIYHNVKDSDLADDIFQETFVKAIVTIKQGRYVDMGHFAAWVTRIAHNLIVDYYRQDKSDNVQSTDNPDVDYLNRKELSDTTVEDELIADQIHADVRMLVKALPQAQREVLLMRYYKGMSFKEIANATDVSINTALGRMRYAILNMRRIALEHNISLSM